MKQRTLAMMTGFEQYTRKTRRAIFLEEMEQVVPWRELCALVEPHYPQPGKGRRPVGVERMLRIYFLQQWFNLSDPAVEDALYDSGGMRQFVGIDLGCEPMPDETTVCKFRHLLEEHQLGEQILGQVNLHLQAQGVRITTGTIVDATILHAPTSTKNREQQRDPEMHRTKKGKQWYFGMKAHVGVDSKTKIIHTAVATAANVADSVVLPDLLHGEETRVWGDQAYRGQSAVIRACADHCALSAIGLIAPHSGFFAVQQIGQYHRIGYVGRRRHRRVDDLRLAIHPHVRLHPEVPLFALLRS